MPWDEEDAKWMGLGRGLSTGVDEALKWAAFFRGNQAQTPMPVLSGARARDSLKAAAKAAGKEKGGKSFSIDTYPVENIAQEAESQAGMQGQSLLDRQRLDALLKKQAETMPVNEADALAAANEPPEAAARRRISSIASLKPSGPVGGPVGTSEADAAARQQKAAQDQELNDLIQRSIAQEGQRAYHAENPGMTRGELASSQKTHLMQEEEAKRRSAEKIAGISAGPQYMEQGRRDISANMDVEAQGSRAQHDWDAGFAAKKQEILSSPMMVNATPAMIAHAENFAKDLYSTTAGARPPDPVKSPEAFRRTQGVAKPPQPGALTQQDKASLATKRDLRKQAQRELLAAQKSTTYGILSGQPKEQAAYLKPYEDKVNAALQEEEAIYSDAVPKADVGAPAAPSAPPPAAVAPAPALEAIPKVDKELEDYRKATGRPDLTREQLDAAIAKKRGG